ncbi:hypothetical protein ACF0H5_005661 [Mactra antiquata]
MADNRQVQDLELLFFDTFSHESAEELNLDLVQFPRPVVIGEVRVIPLQTRVQADVPGGVRLGATNPSNFKLELFVNNLSKPNASTFEKLGLLDYKANHEIQMLTDVQIPTDGLILKGWYNAVTIAIYGALTNVTVEPEALPPPPPPQPRKQVSTAQSVVVSPGLPKVEPRDVKSEPRDWEPPVSVVGPPHTTQQHPLDYLQQLPVQVQQQPMLAVAPPHAGPHPLGIVNQPVPTPGQIPLGGPPPIQDYNIQDEYGRLQNDPDRFSPGQRQPSRDRDIGDSKDHYEREPYDDTRSRDSWGYHEGRDRIGSRERMERDYQQSREGSRDADRDGGRDFRDNREYRDDRDWDRDKTRDRDRDTRDMRGSRERTDYDRDSKDRGRGFDDRRDRDFEQDRGYERGHDLDIERGHEFERDYERGRDNYRERGLERDLERGKDREMDRGREWEGDLENRGHDPERGPKDARDSMRGGFRDRTREDYREKERAREVFMETEAPRSPSRSRSRSFSGDRFSSRSRSPSPNKSAPRAISPLVR